MLVSRPCVRPVGDDDCAVHVWWTFRVLVWCVSPGLMPSFFLPSYGSSSCANAHQDLWWTLSAPTRHIRVGLQVRPSGLARRRSLSIVHHGESHERQHLTVHQRPSPVHNPLIKLEYKSAQ